MPVAVHIVNTTLVSIDIVPFVSPERSSFQFVFFTISSFPSFSLSTLYVGNTLDIRLGSLSWCLGHIFLFACRPAQLYTPQSSISTLIYFIYIPKYFIYHMYYISSVSYYRVYIICHRYVSFWPPLYTALYSPRSSISPLTPHVPSRQGLNTTTFLLYPGPALQLSLSHSFSKIFQSNKQIDMYRAPVL